MPRQRGEMLPDSGEVMPYLMVFNVLISVPVLLRISQSQPNGPHD